ncbi:carbohydrate ABC transporter permease [Carboxydochorda subterranea]|uniref:Carbohydrate ABC transporter permease n=1 Tax=Carboxydichorda subterranea TaxID=3109565 RepID=A0ABZ1BX96_9FIRM|nr:carbohydrate ABC transporter permease [Limnochorda sp. L945t]WRP17309.1 carbohydrate ABC transporter permease [Limnochorda sp. L945t]
MVNYVVLTLLAIFSLGPLSVLFFNSLKSVPDIARNPLGPPTIGVEWGNFPKAWALGRYAVTLRNSGLIVAATILGVCLVAGLAAYALSRFRFRGANFLMMYLLIGTSIPAQLFMVPLFVLWKWLGLLDNLGGIVIIYCALYSPFATFLLRSYMLTIPPDFEDAARVDGASEWLIFTRIVVPLSWPGFLTAALVVGLWAYNEFMFAVTFLHSDALKPVTTSFLAFASRYGRDWGMTSAGAVIMLIPIAALFLLLQRRFVEGLTQGGLRG